MARMQGRSQGSILMPTKPPRKISDYIPARMCMIDSQSEASSG